MDRNKLDATRLTCRRHGGGYIYIYGTNTQYWNIHLERGTQSQCQYSGTFWLKGKAPSVLDVAPPFALSSLGLRLRTVVRDGTRAPHTEGVTAHGGLAPAMKRKPSDDAGADGDTVSQEGKGRGAKVPVRDGSANYTCPRCGKAHVGSQFKYVNWYDQWMYLCLTCRQCLSCNSCWSLES